MLSQSGLRTTGDIPTHPSLAGAAIPVLSVSREAQRLVCGLDAHGRRLGRFRRAIDLLIDEQLLAVVTPEIGDGPFNVVVRALPRSPLPRRFVVRPGARGCDLGPWHLQFGPRTRVWDARPPWSRLAFDAAALRAVREVVSEAARTGRSPLVGAPGQAHPRVRALRQALGQDVEALSGAAADLAGWGPGLTPSGDDYLAGLMLGLWSVSFGHTQTLDREQTLVSRVSSCRADLCDRIYQAAASRTHRISRAFLKAARDGLADARWHALLRALASGEPSNVRRAAETVLAFGATSGFDMLLGFWHVHATCNA